MTTTRDAFEELVKSRNGETTRLLLKNSDGDYNALEIGFGWIAYQAAILAEKRQPLTDEQIYKIGSDDFGLPHRMRDFARAIEAAHRIKATEIT